MSTTDNGTTNGKTKAATTVPVEESAERLARPLVKLAKACGVATFYIDQLGDYTEITDEALVGVLDALGYPATTSENIENSLKRVQEKRDSELLPPTVVCFIGAKTIVPIHAEEATSSPEKIHITLTLEDGSQYEEPLNNFETSEEDGLTLELPQDLPMGYHTLLAKVEDKNGKTVARAQSTLICAPAKIPLPQSVQERHRWGYMTQLYSVRSKESWGVGDYGDLRRLLKDAGSIGKADFMLINPIHACAPVAPLEPSPYLPESRRFLNVTYIRPQDIPEYAQLSDSQRKEVEILHEGVEALNNNPNPMDINAAWNAKLPALKLIFKQPRSAEREQNFADFKARSGEDLDAFATWCVAFEVWGAPWGDNLWFDTTGKGTPQIDALRRDHADLLEFHRWLQWIADEQVAAAHAEAKAAGMAIGLMQDMAVGVHGYGADVWWSPERFANGVSVGAPPDFYNQQGQDWGQPPFDPNYLDETGYIAYRDMVHNVFLHAGAVRIDHVLGLFRLWWIPQGQGAKNGAYVYYNVDAMLAVLSIEATRAGGLVIGEDLGTVPAYVSKVLASHGILGTVVEWFTHNDEAEKAAKKAGKKEIIFANPSTYREYALASVTTHDMPPTAGYLAFEHVKIREELHLLTDSVESFQKAASAERDAMMKMLFDGGWISKDAAENVEGHVQEIVEAMHAIMRTSPSLLLQVALVDAVGEKRSQNQPGTSTEYPNWRIPLADKDGNVVHTGDVFKSQRVLNMAAIMRGEKN
ncbi:4-alpha-glucanotransferase [Gardnerella piotii]|uniref:4-alpha-glucanotransferase n=1 Tax=Gardnerella piotii TaxID=2792977 RepID=UPI00200FBAF1|nr:4-alpha-glucanotransferase [Gardnerella piotii]UQA81466.1 4-alpha-glucanotransferase [Gardnerella piotii]